LQVKRSSRRSKLVVAVDGACIANHSGSAALAELADTLGWTRALSMGMAPFRQRRSAHDPGAVLRDLMVSIADGGDCLADLGALREQSDLFGRVASAPTAWRVIDTIKPRAAGGAARGEATRSGTGLDEGCGPPERITLDFDATSRAASASIR
jgi:hypothetical protein